MSNYEKAPEMNCTCLTTKRLISKTIYTNIFLLKACNVLFYTNLIKVLIHITIVSNTDTAIKNGYKNYLSYLICFDFYCIVMYATCGVIIQNYSE